MIHRPSIAVFFLAATLVLGACSDDDDDTAAAGGGGQSSGGSGSGSSGAAGGFDCSQLTGMGGPGTGSAQGGGMERPDTSCISTSCGDPCADLVSTLGSFSPMGGGPVGGGGAAGSGTTPTTEGGKVYSSHSCTSCHGNQGEGSQGPNITPSTSAGIGTWSADEIKAAIRDGKDKGGGELCASMPRWSASQLSDSDLDKMITFLQKELAPINVPNQGSLCGDTGSGAGGTGTAPGGGIPTLNISDECFSCLDAKCPDIAGPLHCLGGQ